MSNLTRRPIFEKGAKPVKDVAHLARVRGLPCCICEAFGFPQTTPTQAHHPICGRYGSRKAPDRHAIPLCEGHHQGDFDTTKTAIHRDRALWVEWFGPDTDWIAPTLDKLEAMV